MKVYITVSGMAYRYGTDFIAESMVGSLKLQLEKEPDNKYDKEAIMVKAPGLGKVGYVANSVNTVCEDCYSAGRLYDKIGDRAECLVEYKLGEGRIVASVEID
ncbi:MAG: HIRAN domain-containing protein [Selenomonadaceae bacterium]